MTYCLSMHYMKLSGVSNKDYRIKFIQILKDKTLLTVSELSHLFDLLLDSKEVTIHFKDLDLEILHEVDLALLELPMRYGDCSYHEEFGSHHEVS